MAWGPGQGAGRRCQPQLLSSAQSGPQGPQPIAKVCSAHGSSRQAGLDPSGWCSPPSRGRGKGKPTALARPWKV